MDIRLVSVQFVGCAGKPLPNSMVTKACSTCTILQRQTGKNVYDYAVCCGTKFIPPILEVLAELAVNSE